jgi:hypothetical protein
LPVDLLYPAAEGLVWDREGETTAVPRPEIGVSEPSASLTFSEPKDENEDKIRDSLVIWSVAPVSIIQEDKDIGSTVAFKTDLVVPGTEVGALEERPSNASMPFIRRSILSSMPLEAEAEALSVSVVSIGCNGL